MELKHMSDQELARRMVNYIERLERLYREISNHIEHKEADAGYIKCEYAALKSAIRSDADYVSKQRNREGSLLYTSNFTPYIQEADAFGFAVPTNARIDFKMFSTVKEAHYKLTKGWTLEQWQKAAQ